MFSKWDFFFSFTYAPPYLCWHCQWTGQCKTFFNIINLKLIVHILLLQCKRNQENFLSLFDIQYKVQIWLYCVCVCLYTHMHVPVMTYWINHYTESVIDHCVYICWLQAIFSESLSHFCFWFWQRWQLNYISVI